MGGHFGVISELRDFDHHFYHDHFFDSNFSLRENFSVLFFLVLKITTEIFLSKIADTDFDENASLRLSCTERALMFAPSVILPGRNMPPATK